jgi:hypothetical protein
VTIGLPTIRKAVYRNACQAKPNGTVAATNARAKRFAHVDDYACAVCQIGQPSVLPEALGMFCRSVHAAPSTLGRPAPAAETCDEVLKYSRGSRALGEPVCTFLGPALTLKFWTWKFGCPSRKFGCPSSGFATSRWRAHACTWPQRQRAADSPSRVAHQVLVSAGLESE